MAHIKGYHAGDIQAQAAFTSEIEINGLPSLQDVVNYQEEHRKTMDTRPGMYLKYLPHRYDATTNTFEINEPKEKFWSQSLFKVSTRFVWKVIGATNFAPVEVHAVDRFQRWGYTGPDAERELRLAYPELKKKAEEQGAVAFWLLHHPAEKQIGIQLVFSKAAAADPVAVGHESLTRAAA